MTKRNFLIIVSLALALAGLGAWLAGRKIVPSPEVMPVERPKPLPNTMVPTEKREVVVEQKAAGSTKPDQYQLANEVSEDWEGHLKDHLKLIGGEALQEIEVKTERSYIRVQDGIALNVESVHVTLTRDNQETSSFRALVDSQTGKILQTWDQPVYDPVNPREGHRIKIDPRYFED
jgi:hypothetical protein